MTNGEVRSDLELLQQATRQPQATIEENWLSILIPSDSVGPQARRILLDIVPAALDLFIRKNASYDDGNGRNISEGFGIAGQYIKLHDKVAVLRQPLWEDRGQHTEREFESVQEILFDAIGHLLLILDILERNG